ncbi:MAG: hypothetical protein ACTSPP_11205 [Candidatus Heimdallarchaeaceae archaeon]
MNDETRLRMLYEKLQRDLGFTVDNAMNIVMRTKGYVVSIEEYNTVVFSELLTFELFKLIINEYRNKIIHSGHYFGCWLDLQTMKIHFDINLIIDNLQDAIKVAKENNQIAIYDLQKKQEIRLIQQTPLTSII